MLKHPCACERTMIVPHSARKMITGCGTVFPNPLDRVERALEQRPIPLAD